ncbi:MAG: hypothetical protein Q9170_003854 [Blastenia crenularia]
MRGTPAGPNVGMASTFRQDIWPSRHAAEIAFQKNKLFASFDPRVLKNYLKYGLRELPTSVYPDLPAGVPDDQSRPVTLTTTKHQEVWTFARSNFSSSDSVDDNRLSAKDRLLNPSADMPIEAQWLFGRPECAVTFNNLPHLRPATCFIFGSSPFSPSKLRTELKARTGTGVGGSGGVATGKVGSHTFEKGGHFLPFVDLEELAEVVTAYMNKQLRDAEEEDTFWKNLDSQKSERNRLVVSKTWTELVRKPMATKRPVESKL